jgi:hypothetical protein
MLSLMNLRSLVEVLVVNAVYIALVGTAAMCLHWNALVTTIATYIAIIVVALVLMLTKFISIHIKYDMDDGNTEEYEVSR